jgi:phytanoyl-CoA hydroxylase
MLTQTQIDHFHALGYLRIENALTDADIQPVIDEYDAFVDQLATGLANKGSIKDPHKNEGFETRLASLCRQDEATYREADQLVDIASVLGEQTFHFLRNDSLLDLIEPIIGPEITCSPIQHVRCKLPANLWDGGSSYVAPWHQDAQVHTEKADPQFILTVWIPLVDTDEQNGCLQVIPNVHRESKVLWSEGFGISEGNMPDAEILSLPMQRGDVLLLHKLTPHASEPNLTNAIRWSMDLRYQKTGTPSGRSCYPDFVARSRSNPDSELRDWSVWRAAWEDALAAYPTKVPRQSRPESPIHQVIEP